MLLLLLLAVDGVGDVQPRITEQALLHLDGASPWRTKFRRTAYRIAGLPGP